MRLTTSIVRAARPRARLYALYDGLGLCLKVTPSGSKWWRYRHRCAQREKMISLGVHPTVSLSEARLLHADARGMLARGVDPSAERRGRRAARLITFNVVARSWLTSLEPLVRTGHLTPDTVTHETSPKICSASGALAGVNSTNGSPAALASSSG